MRRRPITAPRLPLLFIAVVALGCRSGAQGERGVADSAARTAKVFLESPSGRRSTVTVEVVRSPADIERGLMFRERLAADAGMLFVFPDASERTFWMKNTLIPLDMIFADDDGVVVGIVEGAEPLTTTPRSVGARSRYVLEVNGGWSAAHGVARGDRMRFEGVAR